MLLLNVALTGTLRRGSDEAEKNDCANDERMIRCVLHRERMLRHAAGARSRFSSLAKWCRCYKHEVSLGDERMNCSIMQSSFLPYSDTTICQHLSRTQRWMRNPGRSSFYRGITGIKKELNTIWLNERKLLEGCCCSVVAMLFCLRVMSEIEQKAEELVSKYRAQQEFWPICVLPVQYDGSQLVESVNFSKHTSQIRDYLDHIRSVNLKYHQHIRREKHTVHLFAERFVKWRENAGGKLFSKLEELYDEYLNCIIHKSISILPKTPSSNQTVKRLEMLKAIFQRRFKRVLAGWPCAMEKALLCSYCHFLRVQYK
ncbi:unnamed protein product [Litomosoides sigmodontis]|uniref:Uncharacterized protein n=1 Tax=Litomosoides sigmodontis TaxID=42156 RepID=A0A3P6TFE4_LITSI|nr:unnamed protein product [Litomosoides sigmodontis]VDK81763.1 unnamed protein product [Litomosoides sigmodontis]VDK82531.1 unnamed protein product [Litomosoides sigmodontis]